MMKKSNTNLSLALLFLTVVVAIIAGVSYVSSKYYSELMNKDFVGGGSLHMIKEVINKAIKAKDVTLCDGHFVPEICYIEFAQRTKDVNICRKLPADDTKYSYRDRCYATYAGAHGDLAVCENTKDKNDCLSYAAQDLKRISICDSGLDRPTQEDKDRCYALLIEEYKDIEICNDKIQGKESKDFCYFRLAEVTNNRSICGKILNNELYKDNCLSHIK